jgi:predicted nucleic acid-binding protein
MARFIFFLLLIANVAFGAWLYQAETKPRAALPVEINRDAMKIISVTEPAKAQAEALAAKKLAEALRGSACVDFGVKPADGAKAQISFAAMNLGDRLATRNVEDFTRFAVSLPAQKDKRAAETLVASLKKSGVKDVSVLGDNSISLGVYSSDEASKKAASDIQSKAGSLVKDLQVTPRNAQLKETLFTVKEPDMNMIARLTIMQRDFEGSTLKAVTCPAAPPVTAAAPADNTSATPPKK